MIFTLTIEQYEAIERLRSSLTDRASIRAIQLSTFDSVNLSDLVRVTFNAGWGTAAFDIDAAGNSADVVFGESELSV